MSEIEFIRDLNSLSPKQALVVHLANITSKDRLLEEIGLKLSFPNYYGQNWDALEECLLDLVWLDEKEVLLVHDEIPGIQESELRTYLHILSEILRNWERSGERSVRAVFSTKDELRIRSLRG